MERSYLMRCNGDCGPAAIAFAGGFDQDNVERVMRWNHYHGSFIQGLREDLQDHPWAHFDAIAKLGKQWKLVKCQQILNAEVTPNKVVVLVKPNARRPILEQHWVVWAGNLNGKVRLHWGDGTIREFAPHEFEEMYARGTPQCAYEIVDSGGQTSLTWWQRLYCSIMNRFV